MMVRLVLSAVILTACAATPAAEADKILKESFGSGGRQRTYYLYVPESVKAEKPVPLIVLLHGSGRNGLPLMERWKDLAAKEGIILAGPDSLNTREWNLGTDGPDFIHDVVDIVSSQHPVDPRRVYLFGHSAGAGQGLMLSVLESQYFASVAVHAGALNQDAYALADSAVRKIPIGIWVGTNDRFFPVAAVRATRDLLAARAIPVHLTEIPGHTHDYYGRAAAINKQVWAFLKGHVLTGDPIFTKYDIKQGSDTADAPILVCRGPERTPGEEFMNRDELDGKSEQIKGKVKQAAGDLTGDARLHDEGVADEAAGDIQEGFGRGRRKVGEAIQDLGDKLKR